MKGHLIDTHLLVPRSRSSANVKVKYQGHISQNMGVSGALVFHKHILFFLSPGKMFRVGGKKLGSETRVFFFAKPRYSYSTNYTWHAAAALPRRFANNFPRLDNCFLAHLST